MLSLQPGLDIEGREAAGKGVITAWLALLRAGGWLSRQRHCPPLWCPEEQGEAFMVSAASSP